MTRTSFITMSSMVGIVGRAPAIDEKCDFLFFFVCHAFGSTKFANTETLLSGVIFKAIMMSLHRGRFVVMRFELLKPTFLYPQY